jgi:hypothetical protein
VNARQNATRRTANARAGRHATGRGRSGGSEAGKDRAGAALAGISRAIDELENLTAAVQKQFGIWSSDPPLSSNRQTRFANKIDDWLAAGRMVLQGFQQAASAGAGLPPVTKCSADERVAKSILAGLRAMQTEEMLGNLLGSLQSLANRARQPLGVDESKKLWDEFAAFVARLGGVQEEMRAIKRLIQEALQRANGAVSRGEDRLINLRRSRLTSRGGEVDSGVLRRGDDAEKGLEKVDRAVDNLRAGVGRILKDLAFVAKAKRGQESLASQHEQILFALTQYETQVALFLEGLEGDKESSEILRGPDRGPLVALATAIRSLIQRMEEEISWCTGWLGVIGCREAAAFSLPKEVPNQLAAFGRKLTTIARKLQQYSRRQGSERTTADPSTGGHPNKLAAAAATLESDDLTVLRILLLVSPGSGVFHTVKTVAAATGLNEQKVRRILQNRLGAEGAGLVKRKAPPRGKENTSPRHVFFIDPALVEHARQIVQAL